MAEMDQREEVRVAWGTGIAGYVAESGEPVNIPDAYQVIIRSTPTLSRVVFSPSGSFADDSCNEDEETLMTSFEKIQF